MQTLSAYGAETIEFHDKSDIQIDTCVALDYSSFQYLLDKHPHVQYLGERPNLPDQIIPVEQASFLPIRWSHVINSCRPGVVETTRLSVPKAIQLNEKVELTIFVVDDNAVNRKVLDSMLQKIGCRVHTAVHGQDAIDQLASGLEPDLVFMDCQMPVMDGFAATQAIREQELQTGKHLPIIAVTASVLESDKQQCMDAGMDDHLAKPITLEKLHTFINNYAIKIKESSPL